MSRVSTPTWARSLSTALYRQITFGALEAKAEVPGWRVTITVVTEPTTEFRWEVRPTHEDGALFFKGANALLDEACREACCALEICAPPEPQQMTGKALHARLDEVLKTGPGANKNKPR